MGSCGRRSTFPRATRRPVSRRRSAPARRLRVLSGFRRRLITHLLCERSPRRSLDRATRCSMGRASLGGRRRYYSATEHCLAATDDRDVSLARDASVADAQVGDGCSSRVTAISLRAVRAATGAPSTSTDHCSRVTHSGGNWLVSISALRRRVTPRLRPPVDAVHDSSPRTRPRGLGSLDLCVSFRCGARSIGPVSRPVDERSPGSSARSRCYALGNRPVGRSAGRLGPRPAA